MAIKQLILI